MTCDRWQVTGEICFHLWYLYMLCLNIDLVGLHVFTHFEVFTVLKVISSRKIKRRKRFKKISFHVLLLLFIFVSFLRPFVVTNQTVAGTAYFLCILGIIFIFKIWYVVIVCCQKKLYSHIFLSVAITCNFLKAKPALTLKIMLMLHNYLYCTENATKDGKDTIIYQKFKF